MSGTIQNNMIIVRQGDSFTINLSVNRDCGEPVDITGAEVRMQVRDQNSDALVWNLTGTDTDAAHGKTALIITPQLSGIAVGDYATDIQITMPDGSVHTVFPSDVRKTGIFRITKQVTKEL